MCFYYYPTYTIVGGTPAKEIRKRFDTNVVEQLVLLKWWNWPAKRIKRYLPILTKGDFAHLPLLADHKQKKRFRKDE